MKKNDLENAVRSGNAQKSSDESSASTVIVNPGDEVDLNAETLYTPPFGTKPATAAKSPAPTPAAPAAQPAPAVDLNAATMIFQDRASAAAKQLANAAARAPAPAVKPGARESDRETMAGVVQGVRGAAQPAAAAAIEPNPSAARKRNTLMPEAGAPAPEESGSTGPKPKKKAPGIELNPGDKVNHYELIRLLGKGGMGSVFLARDNKLGRRVAIKFLHTKNPELSKRFILEARTTARCGHENIVIIYEADEFNGMPYMVLEYLQGQPLTKLVVDGKPMPSGRAVELMVPVVRALARAHEEGIVHRDLKPDNIFVTESGTIKVLDFGIAKVLQGDDKGTSEAAEKRAAKGAKETGSYENTLDGESTDLTRHGAIMGTLAYMSPEQWRAQDIDHRTDIWATGIMLFRMLSGKHPLDGLSGMQLSVTGELDEPLPSLKQFAPTVPVELIEVVDRCLKKYKEDRFPDAVSLLRALERFLPGRYTRELKIDESPYAGLASFQENDADRFFGRTHEIAAVVNRVRDQPLLGIVGASGSGKSSFVRAGVVPALKRSGESWEALVIRPGRDPLTSLANVVSPLLSTSNSVVDDLDALRKLADRIRQEPGYVGSVLRSRARREKRNILLFIDQFEELYTLVAEQEERLAFTACLASIADDATSPTRVVLSIRSDFLDRVPEDQRFMNELSQGLVFLSAPNRDGLSDAIVQPAEMAGYHFESQAIVDDMLGHLASTQGALPLLQFCASKLWESRDAARKLLTEESYKSIGGIAGALATHADAVLNELAPGLRNIARAVFLRLVTPDRTRAIVSLEDLRELSKDSDEVQRLIDQLVRARLLVVQTSGGGATVEIVHESLLHSWPTLRRWLDETGEDAAFLEQLRNAAKQWQAKGKDSGLLWRGEMVEEAQRFQRRYRGELPELQQRFLEAVFNQQVRAARVKKVLTIGSVGFLLLLVAASAVALVIIRDAQKEAVAQAEVARKAEVTARDAEAEAKQRLLEVERKERERAEAARLAEEASARAQAAADELQSKNGELFQALKKAEIAKQKAKVAQAGAERNARAARLAREDAIRAAKELEELLQREQERARRLQEQLGSPVIDTLK